MYTWVTEDEMYDTIHGFSIKKCMLYGTANVLQKLILNTIIF